MKKKVLLLATLAIFTSVIATGTLAYFNAEDIAHNVITSGNVKVELVETSKKDANSDPVPFEDVDGVMPGQAVSKIVQVENTGESDAYVRIKVEKEISLKPGNTAPSNYTPILIDYATGTEATAWTKSGDYYYYNSPLEPGELTEPLFTEVFFKENMGNEYQNCKVEIDVSAYATQVAHNGTNALDAKGWPEAN